MTELAQHAPTDHGEQLELDIQTGTAETVVSVDILEEVTHSSAYQELVELRDAAYERRRSGAGQLLAGRFWRCKARKLHKLSLTTSLATACQSRVSRFLKIT